MKLARYLDHPERKKNEIFVCNQTQEWFDKVNIKSKRRGKIAYNRNGEEVQPYYGLKPLFINKKDITQENIEHLQSLGYHATYLLKFIKGVNKK